MMQNNHDRPEFDAFDLTQTINKPLSLNDVNVTFESGRVTSISVSDPQLLTYFRLLHHLERYQFALGWLAKQNHSIQHILDIGSGDGYGMRALYEGLRQQSNKKPLVTSIELDSDVAALCRKNNPEFDVIQKNIIDLEPQPRYDLVLCFELLGNASLASDLELLKRIMLSLNSQGCAFVSIATFDESEFGRTRRKSYSARIYNRQSLLDTVKQVFPEHEISLYGQYYPLKRIAVPDEAVWPNFDGERSADFSIVVIHRA